jgi:1-acyl-sn-glycerol-3-phosphate acyltransferase
MHEKTVKRTHYGPRAQRFGAAMLRLFGWRYEDQRTGPVPKCVILGVPHTTNWDLPVTLLASLALQVPAVFMMKDSWFKGPLAWLFYWLGGIPVNRRASTSAVQQMVNAFNESENLYLVIAPEGTRKQVRHWKLGFYWIATGAGVPVIPAYIDYKAKRVGVGPPLTMCGNLADDFRQLQDFYGRELDLLPTYDPKHEGRGEGIAQGA